MTAIDDMLQQPFGQAIGWALLQFVWQGTLIALLTAALLAALRRSAPTSGMWSRRLRSR